MPLTNTSLDDAQYTTQVLDVIKNRFNLTDYEVNFLKELNQELKKPVPTTQSGVESRINILDMYRVRLLNFIYSMSDKFSELDYKYHSKYDPEFVRLTRAGRPNQQSVDSEIHMDQAMQDQRKLLDQFDAFKSLLFGYLKSIDSCKDTCMNRRNY